MWGVREMMQYVERVKNERAKRKIKKKKNECVDIDGMTA